jgi:acyl-CoA thioester hydrolase
MKPKPFIAETAANGDPYVNNKTDGHIWHRCKTRALYADTDRSQVVYHGNYLRYFEFGRASLMRDVGYPYLEVEQSGYLYPIIEIGIQYYSPVRYDDQICIQTRPSELERVRIKFDYIITHEKTDDIVCIGFTKHCAINEKEIPVAIDEKTLHLWETFPK